MESASVRLNKTVKAFWSSIGCFPQHYQLWRIQFFVYESIPFFFIIARQVEGHFFFWLWIGTNQAEAKRFLYTVAVEGIDGEKISYTASPVSPEMSVDICDEQSCLLLSENNVKRMLGVAGEKLKYRIEIIDKNI